VRGARLETAFQVESSGGGCRRFFVGSDLIDVISIDVIAVQQ
jgi:hypothetical protein